MSAHAGVWGHLHKIEISVMATAVWQGGYCTAYQDRSRMETFASYSLRNIALHENVTKQTPEINIWNVSHRKTFQHHLSMSWNGLCFPGFAFRCRFSLKRSFTGAIWLKTLWKCDSMSTGWHLFSLGLLLGGIFMKALTQLWDRSNQDSYSSYHNKISVTWQQLHRVLIICSNRVVTFHNHYHAIAEDLLMVD